MLCCHRDDSGGMMAAFFGEGGDQELDLSHFSAFVAALHAELVRLEFAHYDAHDKVGARTVRGACRVGQVTPCRRACANLHQPWWLDRCIFL